MKFIIIVVLVLGITSKSFGQTTIPAANVPLIEGGSQIIYPVNGKRLLIITLPIIQSSSSDSLLYSLDTLAKAHSNSLRVIAVPAIEDGYTVEQQSQLKEWYRSKLNTNIIVTSGFYTRKTSGNLQHDLFKWLTDATQNEIFDIDVTGPGYKFFCRDNGQLFAVLRPQSKIHGLSVQKVIQAQ